MRRFEGAARVAVLCAVAIGVVPAVEKGDEPLRPRGRYNNSVHRFFPDLDSRLNAVRYGRWRAVEIAWNVGINPTLDREFSAFLLKLLADPPRFPPEPVFVAPRFAREAPTVFHALRWGQVLEQQVSDVLAAPDATPLPVPSKKPRGFSPLGLVQKLLYFRQSFFDPDRLFNVLEPRIRFFWTAAFFWASLCAIVLAGFLRSIPCFQASGSQ